MENKILRTNTIKKIFFIVIFPVSAYLNMALMSSAGHNVLMITLFSVVGMAVLIFQSYSRRAWNNTRKRSMRAKYAVYYIVCTIVSYGGTIGGGYSAIEKRKLNSIEETARIEVIDMEIAALTNSNNRRMTDAIAGAIENGGSGEIFAVVNLTTKMIKAEKKEHEAIEKIGALKTERAQLIKKQAGIVDAISGLARVAGLSDHQMTFIMLCLIGLFIEFMVYEGSTYDGQLFSIKKRKKELTEAEKVAKREERRIAKLQLQKDKERRHGQIHIA